jgi:WD40 repeat protein
MEKKPASRYQRAREMRSALETVQLMAGRPLGAMAPVEAAGLPPSPTPVEQPDRPVETAMVYDPPPPASPYAQPAPGTYVPSSQQHYVGGYSQAASQVAPNPSSRMSNGCLIAIVATLALMTLLICLIGVFIGYRILTDTGMSLPGGAAAMGTPSPAGGVSQAATPSPAPTVGGVPVVTETFTQTSQIQEDDVGPVAYAPSGEQIAVGVGKTIQLRVGDTLAQGPTLSGHTGAISVLTFSPNSATLASGAQDENSVILWDVATGQARQRLDGHTGWIRSLAFSPDGAILASGSTDSTVRLWDVASGRGLGVLEGHSDYLGNIAFSPDGAALASASRDGTVRLWDVGSQQLSVGFRYVAPIDPATNQPYWLTGIAYSPDGKSIAVGSVSASIYVLDASSGKLQHELKGHQDWVVICGLSYSPDGRTLASASLDGTLRLWSPLTGTERAVLTQRGIRLLGLSWAPDSQHLASTSDSAGSLTVWNTQSRQAEQTILLSQGTVTTLTYSDSGTVLGSGGASGTVRLHIFPSDRHVSLNGGALTSQFIGFVSDMQLAAISDAGEVVIIDLTGQERNRQFQGLSGFAVSLVVSRDRSLLAVGNDRGDVAIWDVGSQKLLRTLRGLNGSAFLLSFNRDASQISAATNQVSNVSQIIVWDVQSGDTQTTIRRDQSQVTSMEMLADGDMVASAGIDGSLTIYSSSDGAAILTITAPAEDHWFSSFVFSPDGKMLVTGSVVGTVDFWDPQSGALLNSIHLSTGSVMALAFRPDGKQIAASTREGGIYLFEPAS